MKPIIVGLLFVALPYASAIAEQFDLSLQSSPTDEYAPATERVAWDAAKTAVILCDVWDAHHSVNAVRRLEEFVSRMNEVVAEARERGATIIHAPSDCMAAYTGHPARERAAQISYDGDVPDFAAHWVMRIESEDGAKYPIEQSDGGEDDDPAEHAKWDAELKAQGRDPGTPWQAQHPAIEIDAKRDYVTDSGVEAWKILAAKDIDHVIYMGVHANMCVLGRPFGLRQQVRAGRDVVLVRDMTDSMYRPEAWPYVDHYTGHDLVLAYIEQHVCPTITSDQIIGGQEFRFSGDERSEAALPKLPAQSEYQTWTPTMYDCQDCKMQNGTEQVIWHRSIVQLSGDQIVSFRIAGGDGEVGARFENVDLAASTTQDGALHFDIPSEAIHSGVPQWLYFWVAPGTEIQTALELEIRDDAMVIEAWEEFLSKDPDWRPAPIPAQYGGAPSNFTGLD